jgi:hypothetical protein
MLGEGLEVYKIMTEKERFNLNKLNDMDVEE